MTIEKDKLLHQIENFFFMFSKRRSICFREINCLQWTKLPCTQESRVLAPLKRNRNLCLSHSFTVLPISFDSQILMIFITLICNIFSMSSRFSPFGSCLWHILFDYLFLPSLREALYSGKSVGFHVLNEISDHAFVVLETLLRNNTPLWHYL